MVRLSWAALATAASLFISTSTAVDTTIGSSFSAKDGSINFALNIPEDNDNQSDELYFAMQAPSVSTWIAVGLGSDEMKNSLIFMAYADSTGKNITLSPRLSYDHVEPSHTKNISISVLGGTKIENGNYTVNAMCSNCRSWKRGSINPAETATKFIYATGPGGSLKSNSLTADIKRHDLYGTFTMDLTKAVGVAGVPVITFANSIGTTQTSDESDNDFGPPAHAVLMILTFVGLMPLAVLILRVLKSPRWHGIAQTISGAVALIGAGVGIYAGLEYNRTMHFQSAHQIFGIIIIIAMIGQWVLGFTHHRIYKRTQATTKLVPIHLWLGRFIIPAGIINGFLGFPLALNSRYNWALLTCVLLVIVLAGPFAFWRFRRDNNQKLTPNDVSDGYQSQPWNSTQSVAQRDINLNQMSYPPQDQNHSPSGEGRIERRFDGDSSGRLED
ncbi:uncharacterized protein L3040_005709 [Drepanopeziza brunnea f. sp. 'multigermtubi']|uniref:uncharacterized protein n=1 Tax=Drepanopeziza brunnea f. sp. 'multigermtubi' TaxID=698441 RepID=UPI00238315CB|nr:hypothetical protein L3040_005709 [Drepanopeziza brunnea f. sp. 'multigermtubi']